MTFFCCSKDPNFGLVCKGGGAQKTDSLDKRLGPSVILNSAPISAKPGPVGIHSPLFSANILTAWALSGSSV